MKTRERLYDIDDLWELFHQPENEGLRFELVDGEIIVMAGPGGVHGRVVIRLGRFLDIFAEERNLGIVTGESGYHPPGDRHTLLVPDLAFIRHSRAPNPFPRKLVPVMPDLAVEIHSPSNTRAELRDKARLYLELGASLVWIVLPDDRSVEVCRFNAAGALTSDVRGPDAALSGEDVLPGFSLDVARVFA